MTVRNNSFNIDGRRTITTSLLLAVALGMMLTAIVLGLSGANEKISHLIVIDDTVSNPASLAAELAQKPHTEIVHLTPGRNSLVDLAQTVSRYSDLQDLHIISHGSIGALQLGGNSIGVEQLVQSKPLLAKIGAAIAPGGDVLLYGCNVGQGTEGALFMSKFAGFTGRDVATSTDQTGAAALGGNWVMERAHGSVEAAALAPTAWSAVLSQNNTTTWTLGTNTASNTVTVGASSVTATVTFSGHSTATTTTAVTNETFNNIAVFSPAVQNTASLGIQYNWDTVPEAATTLASTDAGTVLMTITFSAAVKDPILHLDRIGGSDGTNQNSSQFTLQTGGITLTRLAGTAHFSVAGTVITNSANATAIGGTYTSESSTTTNLGTAAGSVRLNGTFTSVAFLVAPATNTTEGAGADAIELELTYDPVPVAQPDSFTRYMNAGVSGNLYTNNGSGADSDFNSDTLTTTLINGAAFTVGTPIALTNGQLTITNATTGAFTFTPTTGFFGTQTFTYIVADPNGGTSSGTVTMVYQRTSVTIIKTSLGGTGGFTFTGTNGWTSQTITTVSSGVGVTGATQSLAAPSTATTITETIPPGYFISAISCSGLGGGTATPNLLTGSVTLDATATAVNNAIVCNYTNTADAPALTVVKSASTTGPVSVGNVITYTFQVTNSGNRTISGIQVSEAFNGTGTAPSPTNETLLTDAAPLGDSSDATSSNGVWSTLGPGDVVRFTASYTVQQADIDTLQ